MDHASRSGPWIQRLSRPVDASSLAFFRIAFGAIMAWEVWRYFSLARIGRKFADTSFQFSYTGFDWILPLPGELMYLHFAMLGVLAVLIAVGRSYRAASALFFVGFTYVFLLDRANYLNHFYLISLIALLLAFLPAQRVAAFDAKEKRGWVPIGVIWLLRAQLGIVYFYGGIAKLNADWLAGEPMRAWLWERRELPLIGSWLALPEAVWFFSIGGLLFDLLVVPALLWKRTRTAAFVVAVLFHLLNATIFSIGIFPWMMIAVTTIFFDPDWPRRFWNGGPAADQALSHQTDFRQRPGELSPRFVGLAGIFVAIQLLFPLRHFLYPGNVSWTEEGHNFAWHMKLRDKDATARFFLEYEGSTERREVDPHAYLSLRQVRKMATRPEMIRQFCHHLAEVETVLGQRPGVYTEVRASLNGRASQLLVDPGIDLGNEPYRFGSTPWILPLVEVLPRDRAVMAAERTP